MLVCLVNCFCAVAQNNKYLVLDQSLAERLAKEVVDDNAKDADSKDKAWAESLINKALKEYFAQAVPEKSIHDQDVVDKLQKDLGTLRKEKKSLKDSIDNYKAKLLSQINKSEKDKASHKRDLEDARKSYEKEFSKKEFVTRDSLALIKNELSVQEKYLDSLDNVIAGKDILMASLEKDAQIARKIIDKLNEKQKVVDDFYMRCYNSSIEYVNMDFLHKVNLAVDDYMNYMTLVDLPLEADAREKLDYLKKFTSVGILCQDIFSFMDSRYDNNQYEILLQRYNDLKEVGLGLNEESRTFYPHMENMLVLLRQSVKHFKSSVLGYLEDQGLMPERAIIRVKSEMNFKIELFTDGEFKVGDDYYYNPSLKNLNHVLDLAYNNLRKMEDETEYQDYLTQLKDSL